jgi:hypothetical protein
MHEYVEIQFRRKNRPYRLKRQVEAGFEFEEPDPLTRTITLGFTADNDITRYRMERIQRLKDWQPGRFDLRISVEDGSLILRGDDQYSLPEGQYRVTLALTGAKVKMDAFASVPHDKHAVITANVELDERDIDVDLNHADEKILRVIDASTLDDMGGRAWLESPDIRPQRRACVLNLLASLRVTPSATTPLIGTVRRLFRALDDRVYACAETALFTNVAALAEDDRRPFYAEGNPTAKIHEHLILAAQEDEPAIGGAFVVGSLQSFRAEGRPSLQTVICTPQAGFDHTFADVDLDLGNPLQDLAGLVVHIGELIDGKTTSHFDLRKTLAKGKAGKYLYYKVLAR